MFFLLFLIAETIRGNVSSENSWPACFADTSGSVTLMLLGAYLKEVRRDRPVYVCVRSYQSWMSRPLERLWFESAVDQAVMVKRLAIGVRSQVASPLPAVEGTYPEPTAPIARIEDPAGAYK